MKVFRTIREIQVFLHKPELSQKKIGLIPTMGALHDGHLSLVRKSRELDEISVVSIFVNPIQFNNHEDLVNYPDTWERDVDLLEQEGVTAIFAPSSEEMYPSSPILEIGFGDLADSMEGEFRPGHFAGVGLVVGKLLNIVSPTRAYFGQKDLQQLAVIRSLATELNFRSEIVGVATTREPDGLAMSSRNLRLSKEERKTSIKLYEGLKMLQDKLLTGSELSTAITETKAWVNGVVGINLEYLEVVDSYSLQKTVDLQAHKMISLCIAGYVGEVRLLDNIYLITKEN